MNERLKQVRKSSGLTQQQFADSINLSRNYIALMEIGQREPSDRTISAICRVYAVNESWLRTGEGEMQPREEVIAEMVGSALSGSNEFKRAVVQMICSRTDSELETLEAAIRTIYENL